MKEDIKKFIEDATGFAKPKRHELVVLKPKPQTFKLKAGGRTPNNPHFPLTVFRSPVWLDPRFDPAAMFEVLFASNGWKDSWRSTMYGYNHYHTRTHECLGIARGKLTALFGGTKGRKISLNAGDVVVIPAGVGHKHIYQSKDLLIVGCYPARTGKYDEPKPGEISHDEALARIEKVRCPKTDPIYGKDGPLLEKWNA